MLSDVPALKVRLPRFASVREPPGSTMIVEELLIKPPPASVRLPPDWMSMVQPGQEKLRPMIGFGIAELMMSVVGDAFRSFAASPGAHPGKPPGGSQTAPVVSVQFPMGGGALEVTL